MYVQHVLVHVRLCFISCRGPEEGAEVAAGVAVQRELCKPRRDGLSSMYKWRGLRPRNVGLNPGPSFE